MASVSSNNQQQKVVQEHSVGYQQTLKHLLRIIYFAETVYLFVYDNLGEVVCMGYVFGAAHATIASQLSMGPDLHMAEILLYTHRMILWSLSHLLLFNLQNQRHPPAPWRPLPARRITPQMTTRLMFVLYPIILLLSYHWGGMIPCLLLSSLGPFLKNLLNGLGFACFYAGPLEVATRYSVFTGDGKAAIWLGILCCAITTTSHTQDFRDVEGDRASGRKTVPLVVGDTVARIMVAVGVAIWAVIACWFWGPTWTRILLAAVTGGTMVCSLFWYRTMEGDAFTWRLWAVWLLGLLILPIV
ncbi:UbiA prenyltransferase family [Xylaria arbuscula]|nr:UbiA prenyltransferase family [Xylaria arbuscula]